MIDANLLVYIWERVYYIHKEYNMNKLKLGIFGLLGSMLITLPTNAAMTFPNINIGMQTVNTPQDFSNGLQILIWLTILTLAPSIFIMATSFIRLVVVLSLTRQALGAGNLPPNQVITSLALILTFFIFYDNFL